MDVFCGKFCQNLNGLSLCKIQKKKVLKNNTEKRIVYSPEVMVGGEQCDEVAALPGQVICFVDQNVFRKGNEDNVSWVVVGYEIEIIRWIDFYFYHPYMAPSLIEVIAGELVIMKVPVGSDVFNSYSETTKAELRKIVEVPIPIYGG